MSVPHVLLRLLLEGPSHGYDLHHKLKGFRHVYPLSNVNVYPILKEMERQGFVSSRSELVDSRARRIYEVTRRGAAELDAWIESAPEVSLSSERDLVALKLVLAPRREGNGDGPILDWLSQSLATLDEEIARARAFLAEQQESSLPRLALLTSEYRLQAYEHRREYLREAMQIALGSEAAERVEARAKRVLVADDSMAARVTSRHLLAAAGYEVALAVDGAHAWALLHESDFDVLVSDALMPELDGFQLLRRVRTDRALAELPVILNTVLDTAGERDAALAAGADDFVCKKDADAARRLVDSVRRLTD